MGAGQKTLAAAAAGFGKSTYNSMERVLEESGFESTILHAVEDDEIDQEQADALAETLEETREELRKGDIPPKTAKRRIKEALKKAKREHQQPETVVREQAREATESALMRGKRLNGAIDQLLEVPDETLGTAEWSALMQVFQQTNELLSDLQEACGIDLDESDAEVRSETEGGE